jgi:hypothetical protein
MPKGEESAVGFKGAEIGDFRGIEEVSRRIKERTPAPKGAGSRGAVDIGPPCLGVRPSNVPKSRPKACFGTSQASEKRESLTIFFWI